MKGKVYLVGFGPGDAELLTIKADRLLRNADIIFYDNLINDCALDMYTAQKAYVGKRKGQHSKNQQEINEILYNATQIYTSIVRLKGGDPMIFGRVGEELQFLQEKGVDVEIIPGISSASAAAAACSIPLTQRNFSSSVAYCTGHPLKKMHIPNADTLVFFMGASTLQNIITDLLSKNWDIHTPVAIICNASLPNQSISYHTIDSIKESKTQACSPSIIIVGKVVSTAKIPEIQSFHHYQNPK